MTPAHAYLALVLLGLAFGCVRLARLNRRRRRLPELPRWYRVESIVGRDALLRKPPDKTSKRKAGP